MVGRCAGLFLSSCGSSMSDLAPKAYSSTLGLAAKWIPVSGQVTGATLCIELTRMAVTR